MDITLKQYLDTNRYYFNLAYKLISSPNFSKIIDVFNSRSFDPLPQERDLELFYSSILPYIGKDALDFLEDILNDEYYNPQLSGQ